jgi:hypothetical protein
MSPRARRESRKVDFSEPTKTKPQEDKKDTEMFEGEDLADVEGELAALPVVLKQSLPSAPPSISSSKDSSGKDSVRTSAPSSRRSSMQGNLELCMEGTYILTIRR